MYLSAKSIQISKWLVSRRKGLRQMFTVLNSFIVLYLNLIGRNEYSCQKPDQAKAPLKRGQNSVTRT